MVVEKREAKDGNKVGRTGNFRESDSRFTHEDEWKLCLVSVIEFIHTDSASKSCTSSFATVNRMDSTAKNNK